MCRGLALLFLSLAPLCAQNNPLAGVQQDLAELRTEVEKLKLENTDLRDALARLKAAPGQSAASADALAKSRAETLAEMDRRLKQQTAEINAALTELTRQVNAALGKSSAPTTTPKTSSAPTTKGPAPKADAPTAADDGFPAEMPRTGITYRVKLGDTVSGIARRNNSKSSWIIIANKMTAASALRADVDIFVPQAEAPAR